MKNEEKGIYIHIPFCKQKCFYCDFISFANRENIIKDYVQALKKEIQYNIKNFTNVTTIYIGRGTPSFINEVYIKEILEEINIDKKDLEVTIEVNPGTATESKLRAYKNIGINRLSIGLQSANNKLLKQIGRIHTFEDFCNTYNLARKSRF